MQMKTDMELRKQERKTQIALDAARQKEAQKSESRSNALSQMAALSGGFGGPMQMQQQHNNMFGMQASGGGGYGGCGGGGFGGYGGGGFGGQGGGGFGSNMQPFAMQQQMQQQQMQQQQMMMQMMQQQMQNPMQKLASSFNGPSANPISAMADPPAYATAPFAHAPAPQPPTTVEQLLQDPNLQQFGQLLNTAPGARSRQFCWEQRPNICFCSHFAAYDCSSCIASCKHRAYGSLEV